MGKEKDIIMNSLRFLALRPLKAPVHSSDERDNTRSNVKMHRVLRDETFYNFTSDFKISNDGKLITIANNTPKELYEIHQKNGTIGVNLSAIVGENGSGKSTIIDYIVRIINNLSAVLFGEDYYNSSSEHLHYIQGVYAELYVLIDNIILGIVCKDKELTVNQFISSDENNGIYFLFEDGPNTYRIDSEEPLKRDAKCFDILSKFCYTIIVNYSLYSFDTSSYTNELTEDKKETIINKKGIENKHTIKDFEQIKRKAEETNDKKDYIDAKSWLPGILQKYDEYQRPILITPFRQNGQVDQKKEYDRGKEKLLSLALLRGENNERYYTQINNKEIIDKIALSLDPEAAKRNYLSVFDDSCPQFSETVRLALFNLVRNLIIQKFFNKENKSDLESFNSPYKKAAWYYLVLEFFKLILTSSDLEIIKQSLQSVTSRINTQTIEDIKKALDIVYGDHTHVTRGFWRCLYYLELNHLPKHDSDDLDSYEQSIIDKISIDDYFEKAYSLVGPNRDIHYVDELLPPSIFNLDFELFSKDDENKKNIIPFETLSSGEKQVTLSLSTIYSILNKLDTASDKFAGKTGNKERDNQNKKSISYEHVCVIFDELELYYHPEMQRTFVNRLLSGLKQLEFKNIKSIQFIMATHSPFILSDVPKTNVLFLERDGKPLKNVEDMHTFGANIHTMLEHSFFLKQGTMGAFAKKVIGEIEACLDVYRELNKQYIKIHYNKLQDLIFHNEHDCMKMLHRNKKGFDLNEFICSYPKERIKATIDLFDEPILKKVLVNDFYEVFPEEKNKETLINTLEHQLAEFKKTAQSIREIKSLNDTIVQLEKTIKNLKK